MVSDEDIGRKSIEIHSRYRGKIDLCTKVPISGLSDFNYLYTPGVAEPSRRIAANLELAYDFTNKGNMVAILTDGSRVLGLGNIGPEAALPVMEGKALLFKYLGGVDALPLCVKAQTSADLVDIAKKIAPSFGGINLEDIESPKCFVAYDSLCNSLGVPVFHDDQQGTATVVLAGLVNSLKIVGKKLSEARIAIIGAGAAGIATANLLLKAGALGSNIVLCDSRGVLYDGRGDMDEHKSMIAKITNKERLEGPVESALEGADVMIGLSKPGPWIKNQWIKEMANDPIVFSLANPTPEIWPKDALEGGAKVVATGRSDFPNQINNCLAFPSIFRGALDIRATQINDKMLIEAADTLAHCAEPNLNPNMIVPTMEDTSVFIETAFAVAKEAMRTGVARSSLSDNELRFGIENRILRVKRLVKTLMGSELI